jgi:hypothetical protein
MRRPEGTDESSGSAGVVRPVCLAAVALVAALSLILTFVLPRPFYVWENDFDNGHYYNARALFYGLPIHNIEHPGTPVFLLERLLMTSRAAQPGHVQSFSNELYLVVGAAYCISIGFFCLVVLRRFSAGVAALVLSSLVAWPAFLMDLNYFCTESFILVGGLVALSAFWMILAAFPRPRTRLLVFAGAACGLCLAIKLSFVPFVIVLLLAVSVSVLRADTRVGRKAFNLIVLWSMAVVAFSIAILPVFYRLDEILLNTIFRGDVRIQGGVARAAGESAWALLRESPAFVVLLVVVVVTAAVVWIRQHKSHASGQPSTRPGAVGFDKSAGLVFIGLLSCSFVYVIACAAPQLHYSYSVGNSLRNASPLALVVPFGIIYVAQLRLERRYMVRTQTSHANRSLLGVALAIACVSVTFHLVVRNRMIADRLARIVAAETRLGELQRQYGVVAFWDKQLMGPASFHFWGNYRYAGSYFDNELLAKFKGYTWLDLRDIQAARKAGPEQDTATTTSGNPPPEALHETGRPLWRRLLRRCHQWWLAMKRRYPAFPEQPIQLYAGGDQGLKVGLIAFTERSAETEIYQRLGWGEPDLKARLESSLGPLKLWKESIGGVEWVFLAHADGEVGSSPNKSVRPPAGPYAGS